MYLQRLVIKEYRGNFKDNYWNLLKTSEVFLGLEKEREGGRDTGHLLCIVYFTLYSKHNSDRTQEAKYAESWPNTTSAWAGWSQREERKTRVSARTGYWKFKGRHQLGSSEHRPGVRHTLCSFQVHRTLNLPSARPGQCQSAPVL